MELTQWRPLSVCVCVWLCVRARALLGEAIDFLHNLGLVRQQSIGLWPSHTTDGGGAGGSVTGGRPPLRKWKVVFVSQHTAPLFSLYPLLDFYFCFIVLPTKLTAFYSVMVLHFSFQCGRNRKDRGGQLHFVGVMSVMELWYLRLKEW